MRYLPTAVLCVLTLVGCGEGKGAPKTGAVVASGRGGLEVTAEEFTARLEEQPPFVRASYASLQRKKELLDSVVRFEVLAQEAERLGLDRDPEALRAQRKVMVQKLVQARLQAAGPAISEVELTRYYEAHRAEYLQPKRVRLQVLDFSAGERAGERARKALALARAGQPFAAEAAELDFQTREELSGRFGPLGAEALLSLPERAVSEVLETPDGLAIARVLGVQEAKPRALEQVRAQIENRLQRERRTLAFEAWVTSLKDGAAVSVDEQALDAVQLVPVP